MKSCWRHSSLPSWVALLTNAALFPLAAEVLHLTVWEEQPNQPLPCRIYLIGPGDDPVQPPNLPFWKDHFVCGGEVKIDLAPGRYKVEIDRGPEYHLERDQLIVAPGKDLVWSRKLRRLAHLAREGWWSGETHVHRNPADVPLLMQAEDLHVAQVITWWNDADPWKEPGPPSPALVALKDQRFYHLLAGEDERGGGALLYFHLDRPLPISGSQREYPSPMSFLQQARQLKQPNLWVDIEKPFWWDTPLWAASGLVDSVGLAHNHMQRSGVLGNEAWGRPRDTQKFPGPEGNGLWSQQIYYHLLNAGLRIPPSAGSASGVLPNPVGYNRAYVHTGINLRYEDWWRQLKAGRVFVSNGPLLRCRANGAWPGEIFRAPPGGELQIQLEAQLDSRDPLKHIEIIRNGRVHRTLSAEDWSQGIPLGTLTFRQSGWFLVRVLSAVPGTFRFASTGPFYVEMGNSPRRISKSSSQFFLDWVRERRDRIHLNVPSQQEAVQGYFNDAEHYWNHRVAQANAD